LKREYFDRLCEECDLYAPGNDFNWAAVEKAQGARAYGKLDVIADYVGQRGVSMVGHTLLWYHTLPKWLGAQNNADMQKSMEAYVDETVKRFRGKVVRWDVINEPIRAPDRPDGLRHSLLVDRLGPEYMKRAFAVAKAADPAVSLCCNEFGFEYRKPADIGKRAAFLKLLRKFRDDDVAIDCVGLQSHLDAGQELDQDGISKFIRDVKSLDYKVAITELDVLDSGLDGTDDERDQAVADHAKAYLDCVMAEVKPTTITCWGFTDSDTWLTMFHKRRDGRALRPLPFDNEFHRKPMWASIRQAMLR
jgi:endo-1,4-beta-xylanase